MKKLFIGALVGGIIVFAWQALSWSVLNLHDAEYKQAPNQDAIKEFLSKNLPGEGQYMIPRANENASAKEMEELQKKMLAEKSPWAIVNYHEAYDVDMMMNILRGLIVSIIAVIFVCWVLIKQNSTFLITLISTILIGVAGFLFIPYSNHIWYQTPGATTHLLDAIVAWGLCGLWLGWWLNRR